MPETQDIAAARTRTAPMGVASNAPPLVLGPPAPVAQPLKEVSSTQVRPLNETMAGPPAMPPTAAAQAVIPGTPAPEPGFAPITPPESLLGEMVGSFKLVRLLGKGGMGAVFLGEHPSIGSKVAIKMLHPMLASRPELVKRFYDEARAVNLIGHENIVSIFDLNQLPPNRYYIVMEYLEGRTLAQLLQDEQAQLGLDAATDLLLQLCDALGAAHGRGIVHRDLKPENIFLTKRGARENFVKLVDFGIAKLRDDQAPTHETAMGVLVGTPEYMSPEQADNKPVDARSDLYSLGVIAYRLVTGRLPFPEQSIARLIVAHLEKAPPPPRSLNPDLPQAYENAILRALAKSPADRFQTAAELARALDEARKPALAPPISPARPPSVEALVGTAPPQQGQPRVVADFEVELLEPQPARKLRASDISRGGLFLCTESGLPPLFSRVKLGLPGLTVAGEVVRHVKAEEARAWGMPPGFGVQFVDLTPEQRTGLVELTARRPAAAPAPAVPTAQAAPPPPEVQELLAYLSERFNGSHYDLLGLPLDADARQVGLAARQLDDRLRKAMDKAGPEHQAPLKVGLDRLKSALETLANAGRRIDYDAHRGNYRGVARCIENGFPVQELAARHATFLAARPGLDVKTQQQLGRIKLARNRGNYPAALREYEQALSQDPLNLELQRGWIEVRRLSEKAQG